MRTSTLMTALKECIEKSKLERTIQLAFTALDGALVSGHGLAVQEFEKIGGLDVIEAM